MAKAASTKSTPRRRGRTAWTDYLKTEIPRLKSENPDKVHKDLMRLAGENWKTAPENPNRESD
ncbi:hypothetical protein DFJ74DRAFT_649577 [Hyaloraphidium curvatum]|nr:hypothetical protein DFJ74DRAFT_649577 [Hyaloraphidium curvatum]